MKDKKGPQIFTITIPLLESARIDLPPEIINSVPWMATSDTPISTAFKRLLETDSETLLVFHPDGRFAGVVTRNEAVALFGKKKRRKIESLETLDRCWAECEAACAAKGGCLVAHIHYDEQGRPHCVGYTCQDDITGAREIDTWF
jgi:hypothetical protein